MEEDPNEIKSNSFSIKEIPNKNKNYSKTNNSIKNAPYSSASKNSKDFIFPNPDHFEESDKKNQNQNTKEEKKESNSKIISPLTIYRESKKTDFEILQKKHQKEIADIVKFQLDKQLLNFKLNKEQEKFEKEYNNLDYKSLNNNDLYLNLLQQKREAEMANQEDGKEQEEKKQEEQKETIDVKEKSKIKNNESKLRETEDNSISKALPPKPLKIINEKNFHENVFLMEQAKRRHLYEISQKREQKRMEKKEKLRQIKAEQIELKKRIETERANKNLQKNNFDLFVRNSIIQNKIQMKDLNIFQNKKKRDEEREEKKKKNEMIEKEKIDYIRKLRLKEEQNRLCFILKLVQKDISKEKKKLENLEIKERLSTQFREINMLRNNNIKKINSLIKNGVDESNIEKIYSEFPENKEISKIFENYKKQRRQIELDSLKNKDSKKLNPIKTKTTEEKNDRKLKTSNDFKNRTVKIPKIIIDSKSNTNINKKNININTDINNKEEQNENNEQAKIINICATSNDSNQEKIEKDENKINDEAKDINNNDNKNINEKNDNENDNNKIQEKNKDDNNVVNVPKQVFEGNRKVLFETEIRDKIKAYKKERYQPFIKMLEREKITEENRNQKLKEVTNDEEKQKLENQFGKERTLVSLRLKKENDKVLKDIQNYEDKLRKENELNQKYNMERINI